MSITATTAESIFTVDGPEGRIQVSAMLARSAKSLGMTLWSPEFSCPCPTENCKINQLLEEIRRKTLSLPASHHVNLNQTFANIPDDHDVSCSHPGRTELIYPSESEETNSMTLDDDETAREGPVVLTIDISLPLGTMGLNDSSEGRIQEICDEEGSN